MRRRDVLLGGLGLSGLAAFGGVSSMLSLAHAGGNPEYKDRYFIFCYFPGAWDILMGLDPRDPARFRDDNRGDTYIQPGYHLLADPTRVPVQLDETRLVGPFMGRMLEHADDMAIVRGMSMDTLTHEVGRRRFLTGKPPSGLRARGSSTATWMAAQLGRDEPIPNMVGTVETYNVDQPSWASGLRVASTADLVRALRPGEYAVSDPQRDRIEGMLDEFSRCDHHERSRMLTSANGLHRSAQDLVGQRMDSLFDFRANTAPMLALRDRYNINPGRLADPEAQAAMAVTAITNGISRSVSISATTSLDTHDANWGTDQGPNQQRGFDIVAAMVEDLKSRQFKGTGDTWLDHTTILCFSEFCRTALINARGGRDHSLTNACMLIGAGIKGGIYGKSSDLGMQPGRMNLQTGEADLGGDIPMPGHVLRTLMVSAGIEDDLADLRVEPIRAMMA